MAVDYYYLCQYAIEMGNISFLQKKIMNQYGSDIEIDRREINVVNKMALIYLIKNYHISEPKQL